MTSTISKNKKGIVLVELIAYTTIMALVSISVFSILFFVFKAYDITTQTTRNNQATMDIIYSVQDKINKWAPTSFDKEKSSDNMIIFQRTFYIVEETDETGKTITNKIKLKEPETLIIEFYDGSIKMTTNKEAPVFVIPEYIKLNLDSSTISVATYLEYSIINFKVVTDSTRPLTVTMSIPVNAK